MNDIRILVLGSANSGKSTIANEIGIALERAGIKCHIVDVYDHHDERWHHYQQERLQALSEKGTEAFIHTVQTQRGG